MTYENELSDLKQEYQRKISEFEQNKVAATYRDSNGITEHKIDLWYRNEILKLRKKYKS